MPTETLVAHAVVSKFADALSGASDLARAIRYAFLHLPGLVVFLDDGRDGLDTNVVERAIRPHTRGLPRNLDQLRWR